MKTNDRFPQVLENYEIQNTSKTEIKEEVREIPEEARNKLSKKIREQLFSILDGNYDV